MQQNNQSKPRKNHQIRAFEVRLINSDGNNIGVVPLQEALKQAKEQNMDLIEINAKASPIVVKIGDYGKMLYEENKKAQIAKKNQQVQELKEITFRPNTDENDLNHKLARAKEFLAEGNKVKFTCRFRGREVAHANIGREKLMWILEQLNGLIVANPSISMEGKFMNLICMPAKNKA